MNNVCCKEGFLQKAGKHSFQAWRKRWFVLNGDSLKYYNPASEYNESNLLGMIHVFEIQSVSPSKNIKYGFDIITRTRTFNVSAKSDAERDDWIILLKKSSNNKRHLESNEEIPSTDHLSSLHPKAVKELKKQTKRAKTKTEKNHKKSEKTNAVSPKSRSATSPPEVSDEKVILRERAKSQSEILNATSIRANSMLRKISANDNDEVSEKSFYNVLDKNLGETLSDDDDNYDVEDDDDEEITLSLFNFPKPRHGEIYAFDQIKKLVGGDLGGLQQCNLETIKNAYGYVTDDAEEYPVITLLKHHLERIS